MRGQTFWLNKDLMAVFVRKTMNFIFDRRTITRAYAFDFAREHWRAIKVFTDNVVSTRIGMCDIAVDLLRMHRDITHIAHDRQRRITWLYRHHAKINATGVDTCWRTCF